MIFGNSQVNNGNFLQNIVRNWLAPPAGQDWVLEAEWARIQQKPIKAKVILYFILLTLSVLLAWAYFSVIDEVARSQGKVIPSTQIQIVQSYDGGIVQSIHVREGNVVEKDDILLKVDPTRFNSNLQENTSQFAGLEAKVERLTALTLKRKVRFSEELKKQAPAIVQNEQKNYESNIQEYNELTAGYENRISQRKQDLEERQAALAQYNSTLVLSEKELNVTKPLLASGAVSELDIIKIERQTIDIKGDIDKTKVAIRRAQSTIEEEFNKQKESQLKVINQWNQELTESLARMNSLQQTQTGLRDVVRQSEIKAPVKGTIQRLMFNTIGGVISPGSTVLEIIPFGDDLIIETKVEPKDIAFIKHGQTAILRFSAYDFATYGGMSATVDHISADAITDEKDNTFYLVRLVTEQDTKTNTLKILPGMIVEVDIITGKRTILEYLLNPLFKATSSAMRER